MKYCMKCGKQLPDDAVFCSRCGRAVEQGGAQTPLPKLDGAQLVRTLSQRVQINGIIWAVIGGAQLMAGIYYYQEGYLFLLIVGVLNLLSSAKDIRYSKTVLCDSSGVVNKFRALLVPILTLAYNLFIGGVIGVLGSLYYFIAIRSFVMEHEMEFRQMDSPPTGNSPYY